MAAGRTRTPARGLESQMNQVSLRKEAVHIVVRPMTSMYCGRVCTVLLVGSKHRLTGSIHEIRMRCERKYRNDIIILFITLIHSWLK